MESFAFFDVDHTIIDGSTGTELAVEGVKRGLIPLSLLLRVPLLYLRYRIGGFDAGVLEELVFKMRGLRIADIREVSKRVFERRLRRRGFAEVLRLVESERRGGRRLVLASSSLDCAVEPLAEALGIDTIIATRVEVDAGYLTGRFRGEPAFGEGKHRKALALLEESAVSASSCSFYSDSYYDLPLLELVGDPVAVNPDRRLARVAGRRSWPIYRVRGRADVEIVYD